MESITHEKAFFTEIYTKLRKKNKLYIKERYGHKVGKISFIKSPVEKIPAINIVYGTVEIEMFIQYNTAYPYRYKISGVCDQMAIKCVGNKIDQVPK